MAERNAVKNKMPGFTPAFWTGMAIVGIAGEPIAKFLMEGTGLGPGFAPLIASPVAFFIVLFQMEQRKYNAKVYWLCALSLSVLATMAAKFYMDIEPVPVSALVGFLGVALAFALAFWLADEDDIALDRITNRLRELYFWTCTFLALMFGKSISDLVVQDYGLNCIQAEVLFAIIIVAALFKRQTSMTALFWVAFVFTHAAGVNLGDYLIPA